MSLIFKKFLQEFSLILTADYLAECIHSFLYLISGHYYIYKKSLGAPGIIQFEKSLNYISKSKSNVSITLIRHHGTIGEVSINLLYIDMSAKYGLNFTGEGLIKFGHGETQNVLNIPIIELGGNEGDILFEIKLYDTEGGATVENIIKTAIGE